MQVEIEKFEKVEKTDWLNCIDKILIPEEEIKLAVQNLGRKISEDYEDKKLLLVCVLKGSLIFTADLLREITIPCTLDTISAKSYGESMSSSCNLQIIKDLDTIDLSEYDVLLCEDIFDTGYTLEKITEMLMKRNAKSIKTATLLNKLVEKKTTIIPDYKCFDVEDVFIVGYGLDWAENFRHLPYIACVKNKNI